MDWSKSNIKLLYNKDCTQYISVIHTSTWRRLKECTNNVEIKLCFWDILRMQINLGRIFIEFYLSHNVLSALMWSLDNVISSYKQIVLFRCCTRRAIYQNLVIWWRMAHAQVLLVQAQCLGAVLSRGACMALRVLTGQWRNFLVKAGNALINLVLSLLKPRVALSYYKGF